MDGQASKTIPAVAVEHESALAAIDALEVEDDSGTSARAVARALMYVGAEVAMLTRAVEAVGRDSGPLKVLAERAPA